MPRFVMLVDWTDQGARNADKTVERAAAARESFERAGARMNELLWLLGGPYDLIVMAEAPDAETMAAAALSLATLGNVRTTTVRAFDEGEMAGILRRL